MASPDSEDEAADRRWRLAVQRAVHEALAGEKLLLAPAQLSAWRKESDGEGAALFRRYLASAGPTANEIWQRACAQKRISLAAIHRMVGFGAAQTRALGGPGDPERAYAGALFNLGIVLFDSLVDGGGEDSELARDFDQHALHRMAAERQIPAGRHPSAPFAFFASVAGAFFAALPDAVRPRIAARLPAMLAAETESAARPGSIGRVRRWRLLRRKSVWPFLTLAEIGGGSSPARAEALGSCVWIVDDLWDAPEDGRSGSWSRAWPDGDGAMEARAGVSAALAGSQGRAFLEAESRRLALAVRRFAATAPPDEARRCLAATLGAWVQAP